MDDEVTHRQQDWMMENVEGQDGLISVGEDGLVEVQVFHERGPRYLSPEDVTLFIFNKLNEGQTKKTLREIPI